MITEKGTIKVCTKLDENVQREFNGNLLTMGILYTVFGGILLAVGLVLYIVYIATDGANDIGMLPLFLGAVFLCLGIIMLVGRSKALKSVHRFENVQEVEFFPDHFIARKYTNGEHVASEKVYYRWLVNVRETQSYLFLYGTKTTASVVDKRVMQPNELNTVRSLLGKVMAQNVQAQAAQPQQPQTVENEPKDPFADFGTQENTAEEAQSGEIYDQAEDSQAKERVFEGEQSLAQEQSPEQEQAPAQDEGENGGEASEPSDSAKGEE